MKPALELAWFCELGEAEATKEALAAATQKGASDAFVALITRAVVCKVGSPLPLIDSAALDTVQAAYANGWNLKILRVFNDKAARVQPALPLVTNPCTWSVPGDTNI